MCLGVKTVLFRGTCSQSTQFRFDVSGPMQQLSFINFCISTCNMYVNLDTMKGSVSQ